MRTFFITILLIIFTHISFSQVNKYNFICTSNDLFFPEWAFPIIEFKTVYDDNDSVNEDYELLNRYKFNFMKDTARTYAIALDSNDIELNQYFSRILTKFNEPVLCNLGNSTEVYRLIWLRTFHHPIVIRLERTENTYRIYWKEGNGMAGYDQMNRIIKKGFRKVKEENWTNLMRIFNKIDFWKRINYRDIPQGDGSTFLLEASTAVNYNAIIYSGDLRNSGFMDFCKLLLESSRLRIKENEFY